MRVDLLIKGSSVFNVYRKRFENVDVAVIGDTLLMWGHL